MEISPDEIVYWQSGFVKLNATIVYTWLGMAVITLIAWRVTRNLASQKRTNMRHFLETVVDLIRRQVQEISGQDPRRYLPFIGTLYLFIAVFNFFAFLPAYRPPTGSLSTTAALAMCTFVAVPFYSISTLGLRGYLKHYAEPTALMLPFHILSDVSRTIALAVRLFGNVMSGTLAVAILLYIAPFVFPILMQSLELLIGQVQAYIFAVLSTVYIAAASQVQHRRGAATAGPASASPAAAPPKGDDHHG